MTQHIPEKFQRLMRMDHALQSLAEEPVVEIDRWKKVKQLRDFAFKECENLYFPSKNKR